MALEITALLGAAAGAAKFVKEARGLVETISTSRFANNGEAKRKLEEKIAEVEQNLSNAGRLATFGEEYAGVQQEVVELLWDCERVRGSLRENREALSNAGDERYDGAWETIAQLFESVERRQEPLFRALDDRIAWLNDKDKAQIQQRLQSAALAVEGAAQAVRSKASVDADMHFRRIVDELRRRPELAERHAAQGHLRLARGAVAMIPSIFGGKKDDVSADAVAERRQDLAIGGEESERGVGERTQASLSPTAAGAGLGEARLIPHELLTRLRSYLRLRALVIGYLRVQARREWLGRRLTNLQKAGAQPDIDFWEEFQDEFSGMGLRAEFPGRLLTGEDKVDLFVELVGDFDKRFSDVAAAAEAALNPSQSAQSATEALQHVSAMLRIGRSVAEKCQEEAYTLLDVLYETVTEIFAGEERGMATDEKGKEPGRVSDHEKLVSGTAAGPDVTGHQLMRSKGAA